MARYLRNYVPGGTYFFTVVTNLRRRFLTTSLARRCLRAAIDQVRRKRPFEVFAFVLLPDHLHAVWTLPPADADYSQRWKQIKERFTTGYLAAGGEEGPVTPSQRGKGRRGLWQRRFWEHTVRDEEDLKHCVDYVHWNPVKHGLVRRARDYPWSSFHRFMRLGEYPPEWGGEDPCPGFEVSE